MLLVNSKFTRSISHDTLEEGLHMFKSENYGRSLSEYERYIFAQVAKRKKAVSYFKFALGNY